jgi:peptidoglycan/LPS O-acetylase OafA/YrhL
MTRRTSATIDLLRASSILYIVGFWHLMNYSGAAPNYMNPVTIRLTEIALGIFVFLSGYLLGSKDLSATLGDIVSFYRRRLVRIWPLYAIAISFFIAFGLTTVEKGLLAAFGVSMVYVGPPMTLWFVSMLLLFYFVAPFLIIAERRHFDFLVLALLLYGLALWFQVDYRLALSFPAFALGIFVSRNDRLFRSIPSSAYALACLIAIVLSAMESPRTIHLLGSTLMSAFVPLFCYKPSKLFRLRASFRRQYICSAMRALRCTCSTAQYI